jgi:hypothetical protein
MGAQRPPINIRAIDATVTLKNASAVFDETGGESRLGGIELKLPSDAMYTIIER